MEAKWQLTSKFNLPKTFAANCSIELDPQPNKTIKSSASTPILARPNNVPLTHGLSEATPLLAPAPPTLIHGPVLRALKPQTRSD